MDAPTPVDPLVRIAIVTVSYGSGVVLGGLLATLAAAASEPELVVITDNKADTVDNVAELARAAGARYLAMDSNLGYGSAVNAAVRTLPTSVEWILVANPDLTMAPGSLDSLLKTGESDPKIAAVGPATLTADGQLYPSARMVPSLRTGIGHALFANLWLDNPWSRAYKNDFGDDANRRDAGWLSGACLLVRRTAFTEVGGFDEGYFMYFEDVDLGYRFGKAGYRNVFEPHAVVTHSGAHSTNSESARMISAHHASARRFLNKKYSGVILWPLRVALSAGLWARSVLIRYRIRQGLE